MLALGLVTTSNATIPSCVRRKRGEVMIEPDATEFLDSDFTDDHLRFIAETFGPLVKDLLLLPGPVPIEVKHGRLTRNPA